MANNRIRFVGREAQALSCAGKIVVAVDHQHPRDLFDVSDLLANDVIDEILRKAFIIYLLSRNRSMAEVLAP